MLPRVAVFWCCGALRKEKEGGLEGGGGEGERGEEEERGKEGGGERREGGRRDFTTVFLPITTCNRYIRIMLVHRTI